MGDNAMWALYGPYNMVRFPRAQDARGVPEKIAVVPGLPMRVGQTANHNDNTQIENTNNASAGHESISLVKSTVLARNEMLISDRLLNFSYKK